MKRKSLLSFYTPGLISLWILPILCLLYLQKKNDFAIQVVEAVELLGESDSLRYQFFLDECGKRYFTEIKLEGDNRKNDSNLLVGKKLLEDFIARKDTSSGFKFIYGQHCQYDYFIRTLEICQIWNANYFHIDNALWVIYYPRSISARKPNESNLNNRTDCGTQDLLNAERSRSEYAYLQNKKKETIRQFKINYYPLLIGFILFLTFVNYKRIAKGIMLGVRRRNGSL